MDPVDAGRAPRRLIDLVELATAGYRRVARRGAGAAGRPDRGAADLPGRRRPARPRPRHHRLRGVPHRRPGRPPSARTLAGLTGQLWDAGSGL